MYTSPRNKQRIYMKVNTSTNHNNYTLLKSVIKNKSLSSHHLQNNSSMCWSSVCVYARTYLVRLVVALAVRRIQSLPTHAFPEHASKHLLVGIDHVRVLQSMWERQPQFLRKRSQGSESARRKQNRPHLTEVEVKYQM